MTDEIKFVKALQTTKEIETLYKKIHFLGKFQSFSNLSLIILQVLTVCFLKNSYPDFFEANSTLINIFIWSIPMVIILTGVYVFLKTGSIHDQIIKKLDEL